MAYYQLILCIVYIIFLFFGGLIFMYLEWAPVEKVTYEESASWIRLKEIAVDPSPPTSEDELTALVGWLFSKCLALPQNFSTALTTIGNQSHAVTEIENDHCTDLRVDIISLDYEYPWSFIDALYFSMTVSTTIGYGHISPSTSGGRIACIIYSLVGIPLTGILLAWTSGMFGERLFIFFRSKFSAEKQSSRMFIGFVSIFYVLVGFVVFIFVPAIVFSVIEKWSYLESVYYAYITLTTIGFGDFYTGKNMTGSWLYVYQICVILWILIGLGYWVMVANFIQRALKSKQMHDFAKKATQLQKKFMKHDPQFLPHTSKASMNFILQLSNMLVAPEIQVPLHGAKPPTPATPQIPGIAALFQQAGRNPNHFLSAGLTGINVKTDANGNTKDTTVQMRPDFVTREQDTNLTKVQIEPNSLRASAQDLDCGTSMATSVEDLKTISDNQSNMSLDFKEEIDSVNVSTEFLSLLEDPSHRECFIDSLSKEFDGTTTSKGSLSNSSTLPLR